MVVKVMNLGHKIAVGGLCISMFAGTWVKAAPPSERRLERQGRASSQPTERGNPPLLDRAKDILGSLKLSDDQQKKIDDIVAKAKEDFAAMRNDLASRDPRERMGAVRDFMQGVREKIEGVLTDEQKEAFS